VLTAALAKLAVPDAIDAFDSVNVTTAKPAVRVNGTVIYDPIG